MSAGRRPKKYNELCQRTNIVVAQYYLFSVDNFLSFPSIFFVEKFLNKQFSSQKISNPLGTE